MIPRPFDLRSPRRPSGESLRCESLEPFSGDSLRNAKMTAIPTRSDSDISSSSSSSAFPDMHLMSQRLRLPQATFSLTHVSHGNSLGVGEMSSGVAMRERLENTRNILSLSPLDAGEKQLAVLQKAAEEQLGVLLAHMHSSSGSMSSSTSSSSSLLPSLVWDVPEVDQCAYTLYIYVESYIALSEILQLQGCLNEALDTLLSCTCTIDMFVQSHSNLVSRSIDSRQEDETAHIHAHANSKSQSSSLFAEMQGVLFNTHVDEWVGVERWLEFAEVHHCDLLTITWGAFFHRLR
eukprot:gene22268-27231_t